MIECYYAVSVSFFLFSFFFLVGNSLHTFRGIVMRIFDTVLRILRSIHLLLVNLRAEANREKNIASQFFCVAIFNIRSGRAGQEWCSAGDFSLHCGMRELMGSNCGGGLDVRREMTKPRINSRVIHKCVRSSLIAKNSVADYADDEARLMVVRRCASSGVMFWYACQATPTMRQ